jgi:hypothetical protein
MSNKSGRRHTCKMAKVLVGHNMWIHRSNFEPLDCHDIMKLTRGQIFTQSTKPKIVIMLILTFGCIAEAKE